MIGLESLFGSINLQFENIEPLINLLTINPRKLVNREIPTIEIKSKACITFFNPTEDYTFTEEMIHSKSRNSAFIGKQMKGKVLGIYNNNQLVLN
jgi:dihydroorotase